MMHRFGARISVEASRQATIRAAIGMHHQDHHLRPMQTNGLADLLQHKLPVGLQIGRGKAFRAARDLDRIVIRYSAPLQELTEAELKTIVETPYDRCIALILLARCIEMEYLFRLFGRPRYGHQ